MLDTDDPGKLPPPRQWPRQAWAVALNALSLASSAFVKVKDGVRPSPRPVEARHARRLPAMIEAYFADLSNVLRGLVERVKVGGRISFVVGTSAYDGVVIPVDRILSRIYESHGVEVTERLVLRRTLGNGNHQSRSNRKQREVLLVGTVTK